MNDTSNKKVLGMVTTSRGQVPEPHPLRIGRAYRAYARREGLVNMTAEPTRAHRPWSNTAAVVEYTGLSISTIRKALASGALPSHRVGRRILISLDDVDAYIRNGGVEQEAQ